MSSLTLEWPPWHKFLYQILLTLQEQPLILNTK